MNRSTFGLVATWLAFTALAGVPARSAPMPLADAAARFAAREGVYSADLSPDGKRMVFLSAAPGSMTVATLLDIDSGKQTMLVKSSGKPESIRRCDFVTNRHILCRYDGNIHYDRLIITMSRTVLIDTQTGKIRPLTVRDDPDSQSLNQLNGRVIDWLPDAPGAVLMERNYADEHNALGVDRIEVDPFKARQVEAPSGDIDNYLTDGHGNVRFTIQRLTDSEGNFTGKNRYRYRTVGSRQWLDLPAQDDDFAPQLIDRSTNSLYFLDHLDGRAALFRMPLDGSNKRELVARNDAVDIDGPVSLGPCDPVVGYRYTDDRTHTVYTDPDTAKLASALARAVPDAPLIDIAGASRDRQRLLVFASSATDPGAYYLLDRTTRAMKMLSVARDELEGVPLAPERAISFPARDGRQIPAYITASKGAGSAKQPVVILPHGGPSSRDEWGFDWLAQFLAERGYTVIQPNYRGSAGYGEEFLGDNALRNWKLAMSDIRDSADWAVKSGLADPDRMAIVGWSYGGYAALQSAALDPRYKAVVAIAPVTDLGALRRDAEGFTDAELAKAEIGRGPGLREGSPIAHVDAIKAPVLLVHGDLDSNVRVAHSQRMNRALQKAGGTVDFLEFKDLDHQLEDSDARAAMLTKIGALLDRTINH
ncbi:S9 family peptidase [Sphingomonas sp. ASV193]|uniref:alpha/beta hydrolase family protein n=1 Tax=Sphingomonas sp. ASV193 TaxID=3144405 RepID=UPI0032E8656B